VRKLLPIVLVLAIAALAVWLFRKPAVVETPKIATAPALAKVEAPALSKVEAPKLAPPVVPPARKPSAEPPTAPVADATPAPGGTQAELNATIDDVTSLMQAGDFVGLFEKYAAPEDVAKMSPQDKAEMEQGMQQAMANPQAQQMMQAETRMFQSLKDQTPQMNATGDQATYQMTPTADMLPPGMALPPSEPMTFEKIDGRWYIKNGDGL
jgi:hypothetical protein